MGRLGGKSKIKNPKYAGKGSAYNETMTPDLARVQHFIRTTLGCGCPEEVLQWIECSQSEAVPEHGLRLTRIDVGGRLLVYVVAGDVSPETAADALPALLAAGLAERQRAGFNRLRLVVAGEEPDAIRPLAERAFTASAPPDGRVHLHVVAVHELPFG
jgi:hypothetical protein